MLVPLRLLVRRQQHVLVHRKVNPEWAPAAGSGDPAIFMPQLLGVLRRYRMDHLPDSEMLTFRTADGNDRCYHCLNEGFGVVRDHLRQTALNEAVLCALRITKSNHRNDDTLARGLALPVPAPTSNFFATPHVRWGRQLRLRTLAQGDGLSGWYWAARKGRPMQNIRCICGLPLPSGSHLLWNCRVTGIIRAFAGITLPIDRAEERLMLRTLAPAPILPVCTVGLPDVVQLVDSADSGELIFGTDGGMKWSVTSWAVSHPSGASVSGHLDTEDAIGFNGELEAMTVTLEALAACRHVQCGATIVYDCTSAQQLLTAGSPPAERCGYWARAAAALAGCATKRMDIHWVWIPSHGKNTGYVCSGFPTALARRINDLADVAASSALAAAAHASGRLQWHATRDRALKRSAELFAYAAAVAELLGSSL